MLSEVRTGPIVSSDGAVNPARSDKTGAFVVTDAHGKYFEAALRKNLYAAHAIVTAPVIYTTAAGTGGPLLWNGSTGYNVSILMAGWGLSVAATVAGIIGLTGNTGQSTAPTTTTAIDSATNMFLSGTSATAPGSAASVYRVGTPTNAGRFLIPLGSVNTGALTTLTTDMTWVDLNGALIIPPGGWCSFAASATLTSAVMNLAIIWEEVPV